jgi:tight adherence protein C
MVISALVLLFVAVVLVVVQLYPERHEKQEEEQGRVPELYRTCRPLINYFAAFNRRLSLPGLKKQYARKIERAGLGFDMNVDDFLAIKELVVIAVLGLGVMVYFGVLHDPIVFAAAALVGYLLPDTRLSDAVKKRETAMLRALPDFLDLLTLAVEAGLDFVGATRKVTERFQPGPLVWEFKTYLRDMMVGKSRDQALRDMSAKLDLADFTSFANAVVQASEAGASIGPVLRMQATEMRARRFQRAEKLAHEAPVKMLFPLFAFIFPAIFLMIIAPLFFQVKSSGVMGGF